MYTNRVGYMTKLRFDCMSSVKISDPALNAALGDKQKRMNKRTGNTGACSPDNAKSLDAHGQQLNAGDDGQQSGCDDQRQHRVPNDSQRLTTKKKKKKKKKRKKKKTTTTTTTTTAAAAASRTGDPIRTTIQNSTSHSFFF